MLAKQIELGGVRKNSSELERKTERRRRRLRALRQFAAKISDTVVNKVARSKQLRFDWIWSTTQVLTTRAMIKCCRFFVSGILYNYINPLSFGRYGVQDEPVLEAVSKLFKSA